jgi:DNA primase
MPEGTDPAELVADEGAGGFAGRLDGAQSVPEFEVRRALARADLSNTRGRDRALLDIRPLIAAVPSNTATRDEITRWVADRLDVPTRYLEMELSNQQTSAPVAVSPEGSTPLPRRPSIDAVARAERTFLAMCLGQPHVGHGFIARLEPDHFSSEGMRRVRDHLASHFDNPLADLPEDDPSLSAQITEVTMLAEEEPASEEVLQLSFLQLELRRVERALRHAEQGGDFELQRSLAPARQELMGQIGQLMGQTT